MIDSVLMPTRPKFIDKYLRVNRLREGRRLRRPRFTLREYRQKHRDLLEELRFCGNASEVARRVALSPSRVARIAKRAGLRFVRAIEWPRGKVIES
jgi:hypothetical protein